MHSRSTLSGPSGSRKSDTANIRRGSLSSGTGHGHGHGAPPPPPPPPPPRRSSHDSRMKKYSNSKYAIALNSMVLLLKKQHAMSALMERAKYFHIWRRHADKTHEYLKARSERTTAWMLAGINSECNVDSSPVKSASRIGISIMRWILTAKVLRTIRRAWSIWMKYVDGLKAEEASRWERNQLKSLSEENSELKDKYLELRNKFKTKEEMYRDGIVKNQITTIFRSSLKHLIRKRFDRWYRITWESKYDVEMRRQRLKVDVGFQHIKSEREMVKETEVISRRLKTNLLVVLGFYQWKVNCKDELIHMERTRYAEEKKMILKELLLLKQGMMSINKKEELLVEAARSRGKNIFSSLLTVGEKIENISKLSLDISSDTCSEHPSPHPSK